jgi:alpha-beta hydrolase superfamily lysophospholipase
MLFVPPANPRRLTAGIVESGDASFYAVPGSSPPAAPGTLVRSDRLLSAPAGAVAWRVLYHTTDFRGRDQVVSGLVVAPDGASGAPRTVVGWGHPTTGAAARCAPSNGIDPFILIEGLLALLRAGYVVVAPDYPGLGVEGASSYLIGTSEGNSLLDAVRAASQLPTAAGPETVLWGHSQGGHAVLFAGQDVSTYAPELHVRAVAVAAPAADLTDLLDADIGDVSGVTIASYAFEAYASAYASDYPGLSLTSILTDAGAAVTPTMAGLCLFGENLQLHALARPLVGAYLRSDPATTSPWDTLLQQNTPGARPVGVPMFIAQGGQDTLVVPTATQSFVASACARGEAVTFRLYPRDTHGTIANSAVPDVLSFFTQVLGGHPPLTTC